VPYRVLKIERLNVIVDKEKNENEYVQSAKDDQNWLTDILPLCLF
jgi:hypothetical protein